MLRDIVYILKEKLDTEELVYSLRSVEKNFPHNRVWFVGGQPKGLRPDVAIPHKQEGNNKWNLIRSSMRRVIDEDITENFFLFNDDFFVMKPFEGNFVNFVDGTLERRIIELHHNNHGLNPYARTLFKLNEELKSFKCPTMNYDVHLPMLLNKEQVRSSLYVCSSPQMRSAIGNLNRLPYIVHPDVKVYDLESVPTEETFLSTNDKTFTDGKTGEYIRDTFNTSSRFEV